MENERVSNTLHLEMVTKRYRRGGPWVLSGLDLALEEGSLTSVAGANGSGKSTLLRIAAGVSAPSGGVARVPRRVGYVPERQAARCNFSAAEYLSHMGRIRGLDADGVGRRGAELLMRLAVRPGPEVSWNKLSKGNRQKVVIAQAFLEPLDVIVLDEPFSGLDADAQAALNKLIAEVRAQGTSVLVSSHTAPADVTRAYRLVGGRLEVDARPTPLPGADRLVRRVELVRWADGGRAEGLTGRPAVVSWQSAAEGTRLILHVAPEGCDDLIRMALDLGWSVHSVVPIGDDREG